MRKTTQAVLVRFDTAMQRLRFRKAAEYRRWSLNRFLLEAAEKMAKDDHLERTISERRMTHDEIVGRLIKRDNPLRIEQLVETSPGLDSHPPVNHNVRVATQNFPSTANTEDMK